LKSPPQLKETGNKIAKGGRRETRLKKSYPWGHRWGERENRHGVEQVVEEEREKGWVLPAIKKKERLMPSHPESAKRRKANLLYSQRQGKCDEDKGNRRGHGITATASRRERLGGWAKKKKLKVGHTNPGKGRPSKSTVIHILLLRPKPNLLSQ